MPRFQVNDIVQDKNDSTKYGTVRSILPLEGGVQYYRVLWPHPYGLTNVMECDLVLYDENDDEETDFINSKFSGYEEFLRVITVQRLSKKQPIKNTLYAFNTSRTRFYPYQFKPLVKFLDSEKYRVLICDEVGLGKTIEAGLILTEFKARFVSNNILIVCPSALKQKWKDEMKLRFGEEFVIHDSAGLMEKLNEYEQAPGKVSLSGIVSFETIRSGQILKRLEEVSVNFDLVIIDEAHHMRNPGRKVWQAGTILSKTATAMIMLTATPVQLGRENLFYLLQILDKQEFPEINGAEERFSANENVVLAQNCVSGLPPKTTMAIEYLKKAGNYSIIRSNPYYLESQNALVQLNKTVNGLADPIIKVNSLLEAQKALASLNLISHIYTRTRRRQVYDDFSRRDAHPIIIEFLNHERIFYDAVTKYVRALSVAKGHCSMIEKWVLNMPQRQMASSIPAMVAHYKKQFFGDSGFTAAGADPADDLYNELNEFKLSEEYEEKGEKHSAEMELDVTRENLKEILSKWRDDFPDSKYEAFSKAVKEIRKAEVGKVKILVFSFFKDTLRYLQKRLTDEGVGVVVIHGDVKSDERKGIINQFRDDSKIEVLLSSKVGSEGLDFQFCHVMINYDLPWNPMEVEQRIGRLDRIGQESKRISIYHLWIKDTIEERILKQLYDRIGIFERSIGELEMILGEISRDLEYEVLSQQLTPEEEKSILNNKLLILESKRRDLNAIESDAARFIGTDAFFAQEVERIKKNRLYITSEQIKNLVEYFLRHHAPATRMEYDPVSQLGHIYPEDDLRKILAKEKYLQEFASMSSTNSNGKDITFDADTAFKYPKVDFVNLLHPLVKTIISFYEHDGHKSHKCFYIELKSDSLQKGYYFFFVYMVEVKAARDEYSMQMAIIDGYCEEACDSGMAEHVLGEILENGRSSELETPAFDNNALSDVYKKAESVMARRVSELRNKLSIANDAFVDRRKQVILSSYERILRQKQERLENEMAKNQPEERIVRMLEKDINNRRVEQRNDMEKMEQKRNVSVSFSTLCLGCLKIEH